ncbi:MAG: DUF2085 domain-containing protein [Anaerolineae bacterium]
MASQPQNSSRADAAGDIVNRAVAWFARHWLLLLNGFVALYIAVAFSAPLLMMAGWTGPAEIIYTVYRFSCHQLPQRSFFLDGPKLAYSFPEIAAVTGAQERLELFWHPIHDAALGLGYQVAFCERDTAMYGAILLTGLVFGLSGRRWRPLPWWGLILFAIPIAVDGLSQLPGWRESTPLLRVITGALFGIGVVWFAYPRLQSAMDDMARSLPPGHAPASRPAAE